jgi:hypothetical protein
MADNINNATNTNQLPSQKFNRLRKFQSTNFSVEQQA